MRRRVFVVFAALATAFAMLPAGAVDPGPWSATAIESESQFIGLAKAGTEMVPVIVQLDATPLAQYRGELAGLPAPGRDGKGKLKLDRNAEAYLAYLSGRTQAVVANAARTIPAARVTGEYGVALAAISMIVPANSIPSLARVPGVVEVYLDTPAQLDTDTSVGFIGAPVAWEGQGGQESAGEGVIVGVLDSGIWPEHPSMSDPSPVGGAYPEPPVVPGSNGFAGVPRPTCDFGNTTWNLDDADFDCNNKLIGAYKFLDTYEAVIGLLASEFDSARDDNGHGTHTATTAAGNGGVTASIFGVPRGTVSGVAPRAHVIAYRVCGDEGCFQSDSVRAVEQAILDGVDVINFSISGGGSPYTDAVSLAFLGAYEAGVLVSASAGNSGPGGDTVAHREPWTITVGASTSDRHFLSDVTLVADNEDTLELQGASVTDGVTDPTAVVFPPAGSELCLSPFAPGTFSGEIVICERGVIARVEKSFNVASGGAAGMLLYNPALQGLATDNHFIPSVHLENDAGDQLLDFMAEHTGVEATFTAGTATAVQGDVMAAFSSRGGPGQMLGISKPDVTAPGVQILAGHTPLPATVTGGLPGQLFQSIQGTSMSSPHTAGAAALLVGMHPSWTPGQVKSALMTSATRSGVTKEDGTTPADAFDFGSGRIDLTRAGDPGLTFDESALGYLANEETLWRANYPSLFIPDMPGIVTVQRTVTSQLGTGSKWRSSVSAPSDLKITVPKNITLSPGGQSTFSITVDATAVPVGAVRMGAITLTHGSRTVYFPVTIVRGEAPIEVASSCSPVTIAPEELTTCTVEITNTTFSDALVHSATSFSPQLNLVRRSVVGATASGNKVRFTGTVGGAQPPLPEVTDGTGTTLAGYLPLSLFGIAPISASDESITNFDVPAFVFAGKTWTRIGFVSNGYAVVGGGTGSDVDFINQDLPDPAPPNNVLAPYWTDLNPAAAGDMRAAFLTPDGVNLWLVLDWEGVAEFSDGDLNSFQIWIGLNGVEDISYTYGDVGDGDLGFLTVGVENEFGNAGDNWFFDGTGTAVVAGDELRVVSVPGEPGETKIITFDAMGAAPGTSVMTTVVLSDAFDGASVSVFNGTVVE